MARFVSARRAARRFIAFSLAGALVCACMPFAAYADVETDVAKGKEAIVKMTELTYELEITNEDLNEVEARITELDAEINKIKGEIEDTEAEYEAAQEQLALLSKARYTDGQTRYISVLLGSSDFADFVNRITMMDIVADNAAEASAYCDEVKAELDEKKVKLEEKVSEQEQLKQDAQDKQDLINKDLDEQITFFESLDEDTRLIVLSDTTIDSKVISKLADDGLVSTEGSHPEVVTEALKYLGIAYLWAGASPSTGFDCSGLTMYCYREACGITLTHYARTQYDQGTHIAKAALMPGDLVFFGSSVDTIHHVGIYVGNDKFIHAPQTGDVIKISKLSDRTDYVGACRPGGLSSTTQASSVAASGE